jgi:NAD dependent epimerase/dehydratase family enzyme
LICGIKKKYQIFSSRINTTKKLIAYLETLENKPKLLISGSAIGYYGIDKTDAVIEEKDNVVTGLGDVPLTAPFKLSWFIQCKIIPIKSSI